MALIIPKFNYEFDFTTQDLNVNISESIFTKFDIVSKEYAITFCAVAIAQLYGNKKVVYRYLVNEFFIDVFITLTNTAIIFVRDENTYTDKELETKIDVCHALKYRVVIVYLYNEERRAILGENDVTLEFNINENESLEILDDKTKDLMNELLRVLLHCKEDKFESLYKEIDTIICYKIALIFNLKKKNENNNLDRDKKVTSYKEDNTKKYSDVQIRNYDEQDDLFSRLCNNSMLGQNNVAQSLV